MQNFPVSKYILSKEADFNAYCLGEYNLLTTNLKNTIVDSSHLLLQRKNLKENILYLNQDVIEQDGSVDSLRKLKKKNYQMNQYASQLNTVELNLLRQREVLFKAICSAEDKVSKNKCRLNALLEAYLWGARIKVNIFDFMKDQQVTNYSIKQNFTQDYGWLLYKLDQVKEEVM